ncbi:MAG: hypothetical protein EBR30_17910 [Cytophagia bacterium]|nr:hypothetical protein [Cytophagia bacterium]
MKDLLVYSLIAALGIAAYLILYLPAYFFYKSRLPEKLQAQADLYFTLIPCLVYLLLCMYQDRQGFNYLKACGCVAIVPALFLLLTTFNAGLHTKRYFIWALAVSCIFAVLIWLFFPKQGLDRLI